MQMLGLGLRGRAKAEDASMSSKDGNARALRLVYCDAKGKFQMDPDAVAALQLVKGPLGVVSVCGRARQGKSFILNQLLGKGSGFQVASTHRPCTKGLWMWSTPLKRIAADGTEYNLLLLDTEGIDAYDQTGTYSIQIFSLAVLLSSMFVYNQMGGIDETALDRLSLVTEMTKHIRVKASQDRSSTAELGHYSPIFLWLLRDFYFDLAEDGRRITPREYLESALQPMPGSGKPIAAKNEIRESIRALFPDRECFTLVRPLNDEQDLQRLDNIPLEKMRPEFRSGLETLTRFIFDRTRPKHLESTIMTGPVLAGLTQSFINALNAGAVPTIGTSWQSVEENECRRAHDVAMETYTKLFDSSSMDEGILQEAYEMALQGALDVYHKEAVGLGAPRQRHEKSLVSDLKRIFEEYKHKVSTEAELKCAKSIESMDEKLRAACQSPAASFDQVLHVLSDMLVEYEQHSFGPTKWKKLAKFLQQSFEGPLSDLVKKWSDQIQELASKQAQVHEDSLRTEFSSVMALKEKELNTAHSKAENAEQRLTAWSARLKDQEAVIESHNEELVTTRAELRQLRSFVDAAKSSLSSAEKELEKMKQEKVSSDQRSLTGLKRLEEAEAKFRAAENEAKRACDMAAGSREAAALADREKLEVERVSVERLASIERLKRHIEDLAREKGLMSTEFTKLRSLEQEAVSKATSVERRLKEREKEMEEHLRSAHEQRTNTVQVLESLLTTERQARAEANARAESLSLQMQNTQAKLDALQQELTTVRQNETALETKMKALLIDLRGKGHTGNTENGPHDLKDHTKLTIAELKQELTAAGFAEELLQLRSPSKKDLIDLYEKLVLK